MEKRPKGQNFEGPGSPGLYTNLTAESLRRLGIIQRESLDSQSDETDSTDNPCIAYLNLMSVRLSAFVRLSQRCLKLMNHQKRKEIVGQEHEYHERGLN